MWKLLYQALWRLGQRSRENADELEADEARARFWAEMREGQSEAEAHSPPERTTP